MNNFFIKTDENNDYRFERKFIIPFYYQDFIYEIISNLPSRFIEIFKERIINNIYMDTLNFDILKENIDGLNNRNKIRIRWYGQKYGLIKGKLEIKSKQGNVGKKTYYEINNFNFNSKSNFNDIKNQILKNKIPNYLKEYFINCYPSLFNRYSRRYFLSHDNKIRITIDFRINNYKISNSHKDHILIPYDIPHMIMEVKYSSKEDISKNIISNDFPFRASKYSKYVSGIFHLKGINFN